ncbi:MAG: 2-dehydropantoate 2-reductase [Hyphomicrobiaceae bacterium]|nr:2-dehydropantoate 2-reductase [Hyphomicrobiaceae bacterium]
MGKKRIAIVGAGAVGAHVGGYLTRNGKDVTLIDPWPEHVEVMRTRGLTLTGLTPPECFTVNCRAIHVTELQAATRKGLFDIAFVSTKSYDTIWATAMIKEYLAPNAFVVSLQNAINEERIAGVVGWGKTVGCIASTISVELREAGHVYRNVQLGGARHTVFRVGEVHGRKTPRVEEVAAMLACVDSVKVTDNLWGERWTKLGVNCMRNPVSAATGRGGNANDRDPVTRRLAIRLAGEAVRIGKAHGYQLEKMYGMEPELLMAAEGGDKSAMETCESIMLEATKFRNDEQRPSMGQDILKGRRTEIDYLNGMVVAKAAELGLKVPANEGIAAVVRRVERGEVAPSPELVSGI